MESLPTHVAPQATTAAFPRQANYDNELIAMWLHGRPETTRRAYERHVRRFLALTCRPLARVTVGDVQDFADSMAHLAPRSRNQGLSAIKFLSHLWTENRLSHLQRGRRGEARARQQ